ncbi:hypothetical protein EYF80_065667 [Liparis tanakae]|uniref:Uncharacterized protein n=1 Tax=Liparis tanakae TaxID=230148 RepID=A0A4Z2E6J3_9TELE|nr:hypothetical protein EYF80_065667 [Liparis tanakae]
MGCISSRGEGVRVAVDCCPKDTAAGEEATPRMGGVGTLSSSSSSSSSMPWCRYVCTGMGGPQPSLSYLMTEEESDEVFPEIEDRRT